MNAIVVELSEIIVYDQGVTKGLFTALGFV